MLRTAQGLSWQAGARRAQPARGLCRAVAQQGADAFLVCAAAAALEQGCRQHWQRQPDRPSWCRAVWVAA